MSWEIEEILAGLQTFDNVYKQDMVNAAIEKQVEITPHLIKILQNVTSNPDEYLENNNLFDHIYAFMLLGHFGETTAHRTIIDLFSLPGEIAHDLFGDIGLDNLPAVLVKTCGGNVDHIREMALNRSVDDYFRVSAFHALTYAVVEDYISREAVLELIGTQFTGDEADETSDFWGLIACFAIDLYPEEIMKTIDRAYEEGLISSGMVGHGAFQHALESGEKRCIDRLHKELARDSLDDLHDCMSWWACFNPEEHLPVTKLPPVRRRLPAPPPKTAHKKQKVAKKKKRKMAKKAKRKNRR